MSMQHYRAWRFLHPDLGVGNDPQGLVLSPQGRIQMVQDDEAVRQAILLLISTIPGERVGRPEYGCPLHWLIFSPNDDTTAGLAIHYVRRTIERWEPRVEILQLDAGRHPEMAEVLDIYLKYRVLATQRVGEVISSLDLLGEQA
jgi:uncharacterized protein